MLIESIKIKLTNGKELELTADEARSLFQGLSRIFSPSQHVSYPVSVPSVWQPDPIRTTWITTTGTSTFWPSEDVK